MMQRYCLLVLSISLSWHLFVLAAGATTTCSLPASGAAFEEAEPSAVNLDADLVNEALAYANTHGRLSVQIFRHNCRVAAGALDNAVISILAGLAADRGKLSVDDPIGNYLPTGIGWGDAAHRAITIRDLLTETSGLLEAIIAEAVTAGLDPSAPQEALAQPLVHTPGTYFEYSQRVPDLLSYVVQQAIGEDIQTFAQANLFDPLGIPSDSYFWLRDRSGDTYGYAWLFIPPTQYAKLGLLIQNNGSWNGETVLSSSWVDSVAQSTTTNPCYGWLFWTNAGKPCTSANIPAAQTFQRTLIPSAPSDLFAMIGAFHQNNFIIRSLDMTVTWTGFLGDTEFNAAVLSSATAGDLYYEFFRLLMRAVEDVSIPDPGPGLNDTFDWDFNPENFLNPEVLLDDIDANPDCNIVWCNDTIPTEGSIENLRAIANNLLGFSTS